MRYRHLSHGEFRASVFASHKHTTTYKLIEDLPTSNGHVFKAGHLIEFSNALVNIDMEEVAAGTWREANDLRSKLMNPNYVPKKKSNEFIPRGRGWLRDKNIPNAGMSDRMVRFLNGTLSADGK